jgi:hypothetical protein
MSYPATIPMESKKRKRGKFKRPMLVEDDDAAVDIVSIREVTTNTPGGPVVKTVEVPLRPIPCSEGGQMDPSQNNEFSYVGFEMNAKEDKRPSNEQPFSEPSQNKVI